MGPTRSVRARRSTRVAVVRADRTRARGARHATVGGHTIKIIVHRAPAYWPKCAEKPRKFAHGQGAIVTYVTTGGVGTRRRARQGQRDVAATLRRVLNICRARLRLLRQFCYFTELSGTASIGSAGRSIAAMRGLYGIQGVSICVESATRGLHSGQLWPRMSHNAADTFIIGIFCACIRTERQGTLCAVKTVSARRLGRKIPPDPPKDTALCTGWPPPLRDCTVVHDARW